MKNNKLIILIMLIILIINIQTIIILIIMLVVGRKGFFSRVFGFLCEGVERGWG